MKAPTQPADAAPQISIRALLAHLGDEAADEILVKMVGEAMAAKLRKKRAEGRGGWHSSVTEIDASLMDSLRDHVDKGDMIDVINLAGMIHVRRELYGRPVEAKKKATPAARAKAVRKVAKKKPAVKKRAPAKRSAPKRAAPAKTGAGSKLEELVKQATPLFKANPNLDREGLIKKIGRRYERITNFHALRAAALGDKAPAAQKTAPAKPAASKPKKAAAAAAPKAEKTAKNDKRPWTVKAKGKTLGVTIFEKKPGDTFTCSAGAFTVVSVDAQKREIQAEAKASTGAAAQPGKAADSASPATAAASAKKPGAPYAIKTADGKTHGATVNELAIGAVWGMGDKWEVTAVDHDKREYTVKDRTAAPAPAAPPPTEPEIATTEKAT